MLYTEIKYRSTVFHFNFLKMWLQQMCLRC